MLGPEVDAARSRRAARHLKGGGAAGAATVGAAGVEMAEGVISDTQGALHPLIPYLDTLRWLFIGLALSGSRSRSRPGSTTGSGAGGDAPQM